MLTEITEFVHQALDKNDKTLIVVLYISTRWPSPSIQGLRCVWTNIWLNPTVLNNFYSEVHVEQTRFCRIHIQCPVFRPTVFTIVVYNIHNINSQLEIYVDGTAIYYFSNLTSSAKWNWQVISKRTSNYLGQRMACKCSKSKLFSFRHHRETFLSVISKADAKLLESNNL